MIAWLAVWTIAACGTDRTDGAADACGTPGCGADPDGAMGGGDGDAVAGDGASEGEGEGEGEGDAGDGDGDGDAAPGDGDGDGEPPPGCRAPDKPGCDTCCLPAEGGGCTILSSSGGDPPWYNSNAFTNAACAGDCQPCSTCSDRDEATLRQLGSRPECDCGQAPGPDACFSPGGCDCYCERAGDLAQRCPHVSP